MRLNLIGFPHTRVGDPLFSTCAYTSKIEKFAKMGWDDLVVYATEGSKVVHGELVEVLTDDQRVSIFGADDPTQPPKWPTDDQWRLFNQRAALEVAARSNSGDLLLLSGGWSQADIAIANPELIACEPGVGYEGVWAPFAAFESYAWQHFVYGKQNLEPNHDGRWFDRVIPNYFDPKDFPILNNGQGDHLLFVGRVVQRKGIQAAMDIATACKMPLKVAGPGPTDWKKGKFIQAPEVRIEGDVEYLGVLGPKERAEAMADAAVLLAPTVYVEPFGGVAVEAMMCGTPVVATDWGAFTETVIPYETGYRFRTLKEAVVAVEFARKRPNDVVRDWAITRYSLDTIKCQFEDWFTVLETLKGEGWYEL